MFSEKLCWKNSVVNSDKTALQIMLWAVLFVLSKNIK